MGRSRKLPQQRKHKKLKSVDPANQTAQRALKLKQDKHANEAPVDDDFQPAPRSFTDLVKRTRRLIGKKTKRSQNGTDTKGYSTVVDGIVKQTPRRPDSTTSNVLPAKARDGGVETPVAGSNRTSPRRTAGDIDRLHLDGEPIFERRRHESKWNFLQRMNRAAQTAMTKASIESKFGVTLKNAGKGKVVAEADRDLLMETDQVDSPKKTSKSSSAAAVKNSVQVTKRKFKDVSDGEAKKRESRAEGRRDYALAKRENEMFAPEAIAFGERNDRPPTLTAKPRIRPKKPGEPIDFPVFDPSVLSASQKPKESGKHETEQQKIQKLKVEQRRLTIVDQYRQLKKAKWMQQLPFKPLVADSPG